jgi:cytochrome c biogenesis protein CcmG/thiol:disulfide interchange protein DsbE
MKGLIYLIPTAAFAALATLFFRNLNAPRPEILSSLVGRPAPTIVLPPLDASRKGFTSADLKSGHVSVVNVWASWCVPCRAEAPALSAIAHSGTATLYGIVYQDAPARARGYLKESGNPFAGLDVDPDGRAGAAWGIKGVPETFIVDGNGLVRLHFAGPITAHALTAEILPAISDAKRER